ncbi:uncharacterized protein LOC106669564 isoform X2 [Cimex lectularius]|uniref:Uncharacterized protein n=1 Tax=Cimex lectularius TaxID=79782 RepID=A0A8I6S042_CIMLE|nr:uncharacterized protein LOC106669564 isoform X2 [Cimex lectularius]
MVNQLTLLAVSMRGPDLPHRRYSMPETVMRKFRLGQSSSSSSESVNRRNGRPRRNATRRKPSKPSCRVNRSSQTSPQVKCQSDSQPLNERVLVESSPSLSRPRASSFPDVSSSDEGKIYKCLRPASASDKLFGTPSPSHVSCYGPAGHRCGLCSNSWSYTSSDYTLSQTVSDRTTSTQDSTLSVQSSSPTTVTPISFNSEKARILERSIYAPSGNLIAVHTECLLIRPIQVSDDANNWHFGFAQDDEESRLALMPQSVGTITEDDIGAITSGRKDRSTSVGEWDKRELKEIQSKMDKSTYIDSALEYVSDVSENAQPPKSISKIEYSREIGVNTDVENAFTNVGVQVSENNFNRDKKNAKPANGNITPAEEKPRRLRQIHKLGKSLDRKDKCHQTENILKSSKSFPPLAVCYQKAVSKSLDADVACTGGNYKDMAEAESVIARFSAVPRSNSMIVNTSSVDYSSDSDLSLTDSLEDQLTVENEWPESKHDNRLVRGEVSLEASHSKKKFRKGGDAYAYFLSINGEQDMIKEYPIPEWLSARLKRSEEEIKKLFEIKLNKSQTIIYRRRKKTVKRVENYESNSSNSKENPKRKSAKSVKFECKGNEESQSNTRKGTDRVEQTSSNNRGESNKTVIVKPNNQPCDRDDKPSKENGQLAITNKNSQDGQNYVHISEIIKIEMSNQLKTVITKEKQINLNNEAFLKDGKNIQTSEVINNEDAFNSQKIIMKSNVGQFQLDAGSTNVEFQSTKTREEEKDEKQQKHLKKLEVVKKQETRGYSFKQFRPLFESKADDRTVAEILLSAMNECSNPDEDEKGSNTKHESKSVSTADSPFTTDRGEQVETTESKSVSTEDPFTVDEELQVGKSVESKAVLTDAFSAVNVHQEAMESKAVSTADSPFTVNQMQQTEDEEFDEKNTTEKSCNTTHPYLSELIQTTESYLERTQNKESAGHMETDSSENSPTPVFDNILRMDEKASNTNSFSVSTLVQTKESFPEDEISFIEMLNNQEDKGTETIDEVDSKMDKSCNTVNPLASSSSQTETVNEVKPFLNDGKAEKTGHKAKKDTIRRVPLAVEKSAKSKKETNLYCKRTGQLLTDDPNTTDILELTNPRCSCHICVLHKKQISVAAEKQKENQSSSNNLKTKLQHRKLTDQKEDKRPQKVCGRGKNGNNKFLRKFEAIPEEKNSSNESVMEEQIIPLDLGREWQKSNKSTMTNQRQLKEIKEDTEMRYSPEDDAVETATKKPVQVAGKKSNLVIGRFRAIPDEEGKKESGNLGEGLEVIRQYKGRAALATTHVEEHDELMTLSKGWINFYLLKDSQEFSDNEEAQNWQNEGNQMIPKISAGSKISEERFKQYTVEIHATPEHMQQKGVVLPDLPQRETKKKQKNSKNPSNITLPEIHSSSSSSTPENVEKLQHSSKKYQQQLPEVCGRKKRREFNTMREHVTAIEKLSKTGVEREFEIAENTLSTKAVEVARSEHSVSSITSSTVILSESPSPQQLQLSERKSHHKHQAFYSQPANDMGTSWTVTVAGSSGTKDRTPPDVEMKLTFAKTNSRNGQENTSSERSVMQYNSHQTSQISRSKRQGGKMIEQYAHSLRNERHSLQYVPELSFQNLQQTKKERTRLEPPDDMDGFLDPEYASRFDTRSKMSLEGSDISICSDLQVTGLAITPELKPRVPTQSERDLVRRQRYRFTR